MVSVRRSSSNGVKVEKSVNGKRKLASQSPASPAKKRKLDDEEQQDPSFWDHPDGGDDTPAVNGRNPKSSKPNVEKSTPQKKKKDNGTTSTPRPRGNGILALADDEISLRDFFSDDKILPKSANTPKSRSKQSPAKSKSSKSNSARPNSLPSPSIAPPNSFNAKLQAVAKERVKETIKEPPLSENIVVNGTTKSKPPPKGPKKQDLDTIKQQVLGKLCGRTQIPLQGQAAQVATLMTRAVHGESNSVLLLGGPGSAKSAIVTAALDQLKQDHPETGSFHTIRLDGQVQTDDKIALREIARQLALEMNIETEKMSFADTLTTLLYTLSHPSELSDTTTENTTSASVIFILDSFDEFLTHPRQALLYNLFDIAQARKAPIAVICLARQVNAIDGLEKRVKSRFGGRIQQTSRPTSLEAFWKVCEAALRVDETSSFAKEWNRHVKTVKDVCNEIFVQSRDVREFFNRSIPIITSLSHDGDNLPQAQSWSTHSLAAPESKLTLIEGLSQLELSLLIAATRLEAYHVLETFNFNMVYETYTSLVSRARTHLSTVTALGVASVLPGGAVQLWGRDVAARAWEKLSEVGLLTLTGRGEGRGRFVRCEVGLLEVSGVCERGKLLSSAMRGWFKEGV